MGEETGNTKIVYLYDDTNSPIGMLYTTDSGSDPTWSAFWFEKNLQGDIVAVYDQNGNKSVSYTYDAWGNFTTIYHNGASSIAAQNPFRYRGYYYDSDLGLYCVGVRYYDSITGRWISPDKFVSTGQGLTSYNMYAYCGNNPVNRVDPTGEIWWKIIVVIVVAVVAIIGNHSINSSNEKKINDELADTALETEEEGLEQINQYLKKEYSSDVKISKTEDGYQITNSYKVNQYDRQYVSTILSQIDNGTREYDNYSAEWLGHNVVHYVSFGLATSATDVNLEVNGDGRWYVRVFTKVLEILGME